ncbi:MAG: hypothetical protein E7486_06770 [Ruminococcaceae bacterium]|nr:hypothetical protein [Oscillospiraceae bacterium]
MKFFRVAQPVWLKGLEDEWNIQMGLYCSVQGRSGVLRITCADHYRLFVNGVFVGYGPVRTAHGFARVDEIVLDSYLADGVNHIALEVQSYQMVSYGVIKQPGFIQAEVEQGGKILAATGGTGFAAFRLTDRIRKMQRYSFQRPCGESWRLSPRTNAWHKGDFSGRTEGEVTVVTGPELLERGLPFHTYPCVAPQLRLFGGKGTPRPLPANPKRDRSLLLHNEAACLDRWPMEELELVLSDEIQCFEWENEPADPVPYPGESVLSAGATETLAFPTERTGLIGMTLSCGEDTVLYLMLDETLTGGDVDPLSMECLNVIRLELAPGQIYFLSDEIYGFKHMKLFCAKGGVTVRDLRVVEYICPVPLVARPALTPVLDKVYSAAEQTFLQNASDFFMDCPTRERAGWLCDSFFTARTERVLTGKNLVEERFLENFILPDRFEHLPEGMLPMCYPADHPDGNFIPNWAMWFVVELRDYQRRGGSAELIRQAKPRVYRLLDYFKGFRNEDGLLENLERWVFLEWSKANELTQDVSYPSNMMYALCLESAGELYDDPALIKEAEEIRGQIRRQSKIGIFYGDNALRRDGKLTLSGERTETCQYYAFFTKTATPKTDPELWQTLLADFGPDRKETGKWPEIWPANAFIGNYLRLECLRREGLKEQLLAEMAGYFEYMADKTGTLWENITDHASCNHGFASYAAVLILDAVSEEGVASSAGIW